MAGNWIPIPIEEKWFTNVHETALTRAQAAMENAFINEAGGHSRFPGLAAFATLTDSGRVYLHDWRGDLIAATSRGRVYRIDLNGNVADVTGVPVSGGGRVIFSKTDTELLMAAGGPIITFRGDTTKVLSDNAPNSTHVGFIDNFVIAIELHSGRFFHAAAGVYDSWSPLDVFTADGKPDDLTALLITPFRELLLIGPESIEQFERLTTGTTPFFRRWSVGEGILEPYTMIATDNGAWGINDDFEMIRFSGQTSEPRSGDVQRTLEVIDDWTDAWVGGYPDKPLNIIGQRFIVLQAPNATNPYGTKGLTLGYDYRQDRWFSLYGWDETNGVPIRWPGWSHWQIGSGRKKEIFVGGEGAVYKLSNDTFKNDGVTQRMYGRTAPLSNLGEVRIDNMRARLRRGTGTNAANSTISFRARRDNKKVTRWVRKSLGKAGEREPVIEFGGMGCAEVWQFEWFVTDDEPVELVKLEAQVTRLGE